MRFTFFSLLLFAFSARMLARACRMCACHHFHLTFRISISNQLWRICHFEAAKLSEWSVFFVISNGNFSTAMPYYTVPICRTHSVPWQPAITIIVIIVRVKPSFIHSGVPFALFDWFSFCTLFIATNNPKPHSLSAHFQKVYPIFGCLCARVYAQAICQNFRHILHIHTHFISFSFTST